MPLRRPFMRGILIVLGVWGSLACSKTEPPPAPRGSAPGEVHAGASGESLKKPAAPAREAVPPGSVETSGAGEQNSVPPVTPVDPEPPARVWGRADLDAENDRLVAPPDAVPDCHARLKEAGVEFRAATLPLKQLRDDIPTCGAHDAVTVSRGPLGVRLSPPATMTCQLALGMVHLEALVQEFAHKELGEGVRSLNHGGTYNCRKMARFNLVSEHSYGNAIDLYSFTLESGRKITVLRDYGKLDAPAESFSKEARFLRGLASAAFDRNIMSVSLSPYWDTLHKDHFHFDMARYRVDGTRPASTAQE
jgi:hypothetical protein